MPIILLRMTLSGGWAHGGETAQQGAHEDLKTMCFSSGSSLTYPVGPGMLRFGVQTDATPRPGCLGRMPGSEGYALNSRNNWGYPASRMFKHKGASGHQENQLRFSCGCPLFPTWYHLGSIFWKKSSPTSPNPNPMATWSMTTWFSS